MYEVVFMGGYQDSHKGHWQRTWFEECEKKACWVEQDEWNYPKKDAWIKRFDEYINKTTKPIVIIAHSLGCNTIVEWSKKYYNGQNIKLALLVAPPDVLSSFLPKEIQGYENLPLEKLPFKSVCVISENDKYSKFEKSKLYASSWGCEIVNIGKYGHINLDSNIADWSEGKEILKRYL